VDAFHLVIPSLPGYGFSGKPTTTGWDPARTARAWAVLMKRLGYTRPITIPFAISVFPGELYQAPRSWAERAYPHNRVYFNRLDRGGHFAAWEQPDLFAAEMRAAFRSLR
jgi:pimeloyl-ACP methyl ester carboxylesterase